jgi:Tol biopolymer transport system component
LVLGLTAVTLCGCGLLLDPDGRSNGAQDGSVTPDGGQNDAALDADAIVDAVIIDTSTDAPCVWGDFGDPVVVTEVSSGSDDWSPAPSADGLTLFFDSWRNGGSTQNDLFFSKRADTSSPWDPPSAITELNTMDFADAAAAPTADGLTLFFTSDRGGEDRDIWQAQRATVESPFDAPVIVEGINSSSHDSNAHISLDGLRIYFSSARNDSGDLFVAERTSSTATFGTPTRIDVVSSDGSSETAPTLSADETEIYFSSDRAGGQGRIDIWFATRPDPAAPFSEPTNLGPVLNTDWDDTQPALSADGRTLYMVRDACFSGGCGFDGDIWKAERVCEP